MTKAWGIAAAWLAVTGAAQAASLEAYGRLPAIEDVQISPDGTMLALSMTNGEARTVIVRRLADGKTLGGLKVSDDKLRDIRWAGSDHLLITTSQTASVHGLEDRSASEYMQTLDYDVVRNKQRALLEGQEEAMNVVLQAPLVRIIEGQPHAFLQGVQFVNNVGRRALYRVNLVTRRTTLIDADDIRAQDWTVASDGALVALSTYDDVTGRWNLKLKDNGRWVNARQWTSPWGPPSLEGLGRDPRSTVVLALDEDGSLMRRELKVVDGAAVETVVEGGFDALIADPLAQTAIGGYALVGDEARYSFFDAKAQAAWRGVARSFAGDRVDLVSWSDDRRKIIVKVDGPADGAAYGLVDLDAKRADLIGRVYSGVGPEEVAEVRPVSYEAKDGLRIAGYLTLPKGKAAKNLPLVVLPHGGPAARDQPGFDWWSQALAARGYAVLRPNFRGSDGFGWSFMAAGFGEWGRKMQTDLSDGVRHLAAEGLIDPKRVCVVGASYGGYAALAGATLDPGVYRCAAAVAGVADPQRFLQWSQGRAGSRQSARLRYWSRFMGVDGIRDPDLAAISPAKLADKVEIPVLLIHGKDDTVVPYEQSQIMAAALRKAGKPVEFVTLNGEDHWLSRGATRLQMLTAVTAFLEKNNPPD